MRSPTWHRESSSGALYTAWKQDCWMWASHGAHGSWDRPLANTVRTGDPKEQDGRKQDYPVNTL
jgi:hypothetical protein